MAHVGKQISNPVTGERGIFLETADSTNGQALKLDAFMAAHGFVAMEHVHRHQEERFEIIKGPIFLRVNGQQQVANDGDVLVVPAGASHVWWNPGDQEVHVQTTHHPALEMENLLENAAGLAVHGRVNAKTGLPYFWQLVVFADYYFHVMCAAKPAQLLQRIFFGALAPIGRLLGYQPKYFDYTN